MKFPESKAAIVADEIRDTLSGSCERIEIAGSLRRRKPEVSDVEILFVPVIKPGTHRVDMFAAPAQENFTEAVLAALLAMGLLTKRLNVNGKEAWGAKNKLAVHAASGIPVDLFTATPTNFFNYLVCRTGPSESNIRICEAAIRKGWKWNPYGNGFSRNGDVHACASERDVFDFVGLPYKEPWER